MDQKIILAETLKSLERIEQVIDDEIRSAREDNEVLMEALGDARISILKISYKFNMERSKQGMCRRGAGGGARRGSRADRGGASGDRHGEEHIERRQMFGRRSEDSNHSHSISESRSHRPMFGSQ